MTRSILLTMCLAACAGYRLDADTDRKGTGDTGSTPDTDSDTDTDADSDTDIDVDSDTDTNTDTDSDTDTDTDSGAVPWSNTGIVDGATSEYGPDETFATTGGTAYITWDATDLFVAVQHADVGGGGALHWLQLYLGDGSGTGATSGVPHNTQQPDLPTPMSTLVRWKADGSFDSLETWSGSEWTSTEFWLGTEGSALAEDDASSIVEMRIPLALVGATDTLDLHMAWVYEGPGYESTYAATPAVSFVDGYDPDFASWYRFDLQGPTPPSDTRPSP